MCVKAEYSDGDRLLSKFCEGEYDDGDVESLKRLLGEVGCIEVSVGVTRLLAGNKFFGISTPYGSVVDFYVVFVVVSEYSCGECVDGLVWDYENRTYGKCPVCGNDGSWKYYVMLRKKIMEE